MANFFRSREAGVRLLIALLLVFRRTETIPLLLCPSLPCVSSVHMIPPPPACVRRTNSQDGFLDKKRAGRKRERKNGNRYYTTLWSGILRTVYILKFNQNGPYISGQSGIIRLSTEISRKVSTRSFQNNHNFHCVCPPFVSCVWKKSARNRGVSHT